MRRPARRRGHHCPAHRPLGAPGPRAMGAGELRRVHPAAVLPAAGPERSGSRGRRAWPRWPASCSAECSRPTERPSTRSATSPEASGRPRPPSSSRCRSWPRRSSSPPESPGNSAGTCAGTAPGRRRSPLSSAPRPTWPRPPRSGPGPTPRTGRRATAPGRARPGYVTAPWGGAAERCRSRPAARHRTLCPDGPGPAAAGELTTIEARLVDWRTSRSRAGSPVPVSVVPATWAPPGPD